MIHPDFIVFVCDDQHSFFFVFLLRVPSFQLIFSFSTFSDFDFNKNETIAHRFQQFIYFDCLLFVFLEHEKNSN